MISYEDATGILTSRMSQSDHRIAAVDLGLDALEQQVKRFREFVDTALLDAWPPVVHIAGSKGKGSTALFATSILQQAGYRVGTFTSPHLHSWCERIAVDSQPISETDFARIAEIILQAESSDLADSGLSTKLNTFEFLTAMAIRYFAQEQCDVFVFEVGLGGRFDPTNAVIPAVSVITRIELEHTDILGPTLTEIAWNKAGIIRASTPVVTCIQSPEAEIVIGSTCRTMQAPLYAEERDWQWTGSSAQFRYEDAGGSIDALQTPVPGEHQVRNACLAICAIRQLADLEIHVDPASIRSGIAMTMLPGRYEVIASQGRIFIVDTAHTEESAAKLAETLRADSIPQVDMILGTLQDKNTRGILESIRHVVRELIVVPPHSQRAATPTQTEATARDLGLQADSSSSLADALDRMMNSSREPLPIIITGSSQLAAEAQTLLQPDVASGTEQGSHPERSHLKVGTID